MYESLLGWCKFPVNLHVRSGFSASGDEITTAPVVKNGYRVDEMKKIIDKEGKEYISTTHVYFPPEVTVTVDDMLSFASDSTPREIRKLGGFFDGVTGLLSITVVYL